MTDIYMNTNWGPTLLTLVARGSSIICEICRLAEYIPVEYKTTKHEYTEILSDFVYFSTSEAFEHKIDSKQDLQDLDEKFKDNYIQLLERFYRLFESIFKYISDLNYFLTSLEDGHFVQHDLVSVMQNEDGKQLMCEALYLYGSMLLLIDRKIDGHIREKMLISFYRYSYKQSNLDSNSEEVCQLLRSTGFHLNLAVNKRPADYPESFLRRIPIDARYISMVIDKLRSDDFYHQTLAYPMPEHRSVARATQANMLYVCLFFSPGSLHNQPALMREIVDKHFSDNWVLGGYLGHTVNLVDSWAPYKAASTALSNAVELGNVKDLARRHCTLLNKQLPTIEKLLAEGVLVRSYVLDKVSRLMDRVRECNVTLRWLMLHSSAWESNKLSKKAAALRDIVTQTPGFEERKVFKLLVLTSQFELRLGDTLREILDTRQSSWAALKEESVGRMQELAEVFSGAKALARVNPNDKLQDWFQRLAEQIRTLSPEQQPVMAEDDSKFANNAGATAAGRTLDQLIQALKEVLEFHQLDSNVVVRQFVSETCTSLQHMLRLLNLQDRLLLDLSICSDVGYALNIVEIYTGYMQEGLTKDPFLAIQLRAVFLKLASSLDSPLIRLNQCNSKDLLSVTQYYSNELVLYVRRVLQIIPETMFAKMADIIQLQTTQLRELPTRLDKDKIKDYLYFEPRALVAKLTHDISVFTQGVLMMKTTLVGIKELDPHKLLEDGIRKELVIHVTKALDSKLVFSSRTKFTDLELKLDELAIAMDGYRRSFEYIQDYVNIYGLKMWREEVSRIINFNVERECNVFMKNKIPEYKSSYQSKTIPIPVYPPIDENLTFIGRLIDQILKVTDPRVCTFLPHLTSWYDIRSKTEVANMRIFSKLEEVFNSFGLSSFDRLLGLLIVRELQGYLRHIQNSFRDPKVLNSINNFLKIVNPVSKIVDVKAYLETTQRLSKCAPQAVEIILKIGQLQLLRQMIAAQLSLSCKFEAKFLHSALVTLNDALLTDLQHHLLSPKTIPYPGKNKIDGESNESEEEDDEDEDDDIDGANQHRDIVHLTTRLLHSAGLHDPVNQVYITTQRFKFGSVYPFLVLISVLNKMVYSRPGDCPIARRAGSEAVDAHVLTLGLVTLLNQVHPILSKEWMGLISQYIRSIAAAQQSKIIPSDLVNCVMMLEDFCQISGKPANVLHTLIPPYLLYNIRSNVRSATDA